MNDPLKLTLTKLPNTNTLIFNQEVPNTIFLGTSTSFIIPINNFIVILNRLVKLGHIKPEILKGILEEIHTA